MGNGRPWWVIVGGRRRLGRHLAQGLATSCNLVLTSGKPWEDEPWIKELAGSTQVRTLTWNAEHPDVAALMMADSEALKADGISPGAAVFLPGLFPEQPFGTWTPEALQGLWHVNVTFPMLAIQALAPHMAPGGCLHLILDTCIYRPFLRRLPYSASKAGLAILVPGLARQLAPTLRVVGHALGTVLPAPGMDPTALAQRTLLQTPGRPEDLLAALQYAQNAPYLTGEILTLDGGYRWS